MASKLMIGQQAVIRISRDCGENPLLVATTALEALPTNFIIQSISFKSRADKAGLPFLATGRTLTIGNAAAAAGYSADVVSGAAAEKVVRGKGALVYNSTDKEFIELAVSDANEALNVTVATASITQGAFDIFVQGYQA